MARPGAVAEWLGRGLQSLVQQFESARRLEACIHAGLRAFRFDVSAAVLTELVHSGPKFSSSRKCRQTSVTRVDEWRPRSSFTA